MLDNKRIKEAETNFRTYLEDGLLKKESFSKTVFQAYRRNYSESISLLNNVYHNNLSYLWTIVIAYYSMFYLSNALLYQLGYKVGPKIAHKITADALIYLVREKIKASLLEEFEAAKDEALGLASAKADELVLSFDQERIKRSMFQYETTEEIKSSKARTSFQRATDFCNEILKLLDERT